MPSSGGTTGTAVSGGTPLSGTTYKRQRTNLLPLEAWRRAMGYHPWHFWGLTNDDKLKITSACNTIVTQYAWQKGDALSRDSIRMGIIAAEARLREWLNFSVGRVFVEETLRFPRPKHYGHEYLSSIDGDGRWLGVRTSEGFLRSIGKETYSLLDGAATAAPTDEDGDGVADTFTVTIAGVTGTLDQIGVYFGASDRLDGEPVSEKYRIAPVSMSLNSGTLTIKGRLYLLVKPIKYEGVSVSAGLNPATSGVLATTVAVYRRYADPTGTTTDDCQAVLIWETEPYPQWAICDNSLTFTDNSADPAALAYATARAQIRDARTGEVGVGGATYDSTTGLWAATNFNICRQPDRVILRYEAGAKLDSLSSSTDQLSRIAGVWDQIVARFACAEMSRRTFGCQDATMEIYRWQFDLSRSAGANDEQYRISEGDLSNPFGTAAGAVYAWKNVMNLGVTRAVLLG